MAWNEDYEDERPHSKQEAYYESAPFPCWCEECGEECEPVRSEVGIGAYEAWGYRGYDGGYQWVSDCCSASLLEEDPSEEEEDEGKNGLFE